MIRSIPWGGLKIFAMVTLAWFVSTRAVNAQEEDGVAKFIQSHPGYRGYVTPLPPYPHALASSHVGGKMVVKIVYAAEGNVADVILEKSSGLRSLDDSTMRYVKKHWRSTLGKRSEHDQTFDFRPQGSAVGLSNSYH